MVNEWKELSFNELGEVNRGRSKHRPRYAEHLYGGPYPFIQTGDIKASNGRIVKHTQTYSKAGLGQSRLWPKDTMCITIAANIAETAILTYPACFPDSVVGFIANENKCDVRFIEYSFRLLKQRIQSEATGSVQDNINLATLSRLTFPIPPLPEQKKIAHILGSLDDKIELNRQMNATLEGMAQALFKSWFVDFDPVIDNALAAGNPIPEAFTARAETRRKALAHGTANRDVAKQFPAAFQLTEEMGWIPEGWEMAKLSELLEVKYGKAHKNLSEGHIPVYGSGGLMRHADKSLYEGESVLIPRKGTLSNILYLNEEFWTVDTMFYTIPKIKFTPKYIFYHLKALDFESMNVGSAVPSMTTKVLNELLILMPEKMMLQNFDVILNSYFLKIRANNTQSKTLSNLRDTLLPKLISGEIRIPEAEKLTEEALA